MSRKYRALVEASVEERSSVLPTHELSEAKTAALLEIVQRLAKTSDAKDELLYAERRNFPRRTLGQLVLVTPCDNLDQPRIEASEVVMARDISASGISFVHSRRPPEEQILVTLNFHEPLPPCLLGVIRHVQPVRQGFYLVGVEFLQRVHLVNVESLSRDDSQGTGDADNCW
jgi:hypothetical protein